MNEIVKLLQNKSNLHDLEQGLALLSSLNKEEFQQHQEREAGEGGATVSLVSLLTQLSSDEELNAKIRRKMKRILQFIVPDEIKEKITTEQGEGEEGKEKSKQNQEIIEENPSNILVLARECIHQLEKNNSPDQIEESLTKLPVTEFLIRDSCVNHLIQSLENFPNRSDLQINAKLRRRVKRLGETLSNLKSSTKSDPAPQTGAGQEAEEDVVVHVVEKVSLPKTLNLLSSVKTFREVEYALNSMQLPDLKSMDSSEKELVSSIREKLETIFSSDDQQLTNKKLRHRMKKIIYILSGGNSIVKKPEPKAPNPPVIKSTPQPKSPALSRQTPAQISHPLLASLKRIKTSDELNELLTGIPTRSAELLEYFSGNIQIVEAVRQIIIEKIELSATEATQKITLTAKIRRKVTRFVEALQEILTPPSEPEEEPKVVLETKTESHSPETSSTQPVQTNDDIEEEFKITIKETKKRKRTETPPETSTSISSDSKPEPSITYDEVIKQLREATSSKQIEKILKTIISNWEKTIGIGCCRTRRALKRAIESLVSNPDGDANYEQPSVKLSPAAKELVQQSLNTIETITATAIQAHISSIGTKPTNFVDSNIPSQKKKKSEDATPTVKSEKNEEKSQENVENNEKEDDDQSIRLGQISQHKHILFIGQLSYDTTSDDLLEYLKSSGVTGEISVRLLTDKETGRSKGAAFIDLFGGKRSLKRILDLHHTMLKGRRINVEHTSKHGTNISETEEHSLKIKQERMQQKIIESEKIDEIMMKYSYLNLGEKGGILSDDNMMNRLYAMNVNEVTDIFEEYIQQNERKEQRNLPLFYEIITRHDHGGTAVDQTKDRKRRYDENEWKSNENYDQRNKKSSSGFGQFRAHAHSSQSSNETHWSPGAKSIRGGGGRGMRGRGGVMDLFGRGRGGR